MRELYLERGACEKERDRKITLKGKRWDRERKAMEKGEKEKILREKKSK